MAGVFGRWDWVANTVLFGLYHVHKIWFWPSMIASSFGYAWAARRFQWRIKELVDGTIPDGLVGEDFKDVKSALDDLGFSNVETVAAKSEDPDTKPGEVTSISPREGATVPLDSKITVRYATA
jgi:hypothetical protein